MSLRPKFRNTNCWWMESSPSVSGQSCSLYPLGESRGMQPDPDDEWGGTLVQHCVWPHRHWPGLSGGCGVSNLTCWPLQMCCHGTGKGTTFPPLTAGSQFCARGNTNPAGVTVLGESLHCAWEVSHRCYSGRAPLGDGSDEPGGTS